MSEYRICVRCIMDTSDPLIQFDDQGVCNHCKKAERLLGSEPICLSEADKALRLKELAAKIKEAGKSKKYDCIIGVSGGVDSTYAAWLVKEAGLRPLAVHLDNGWDSRLAVSNIERVLKKLEIDLYTYVIDWGEFKDLQLSFLKASTPDSEIPSDHAIVALLYKMAAKHGVRYILAGTNIATESILPRAWSYGHSDWKYIKRIHKRFGKLGIKTFPHFSLYGLFRYLVIKKIRFVSLLNYTEYNRQDAIRLLENDLGWENYGGKHLESVYTHFYQSWILPNKFGFDKRRAHLSSMIMAGHITRKQALEELQKDIFPPQKLREDKDYVVSKFGLSEEQFDAIMSLPVKTFHDYPSYENSWYYRFFMKTYRFLGKFGIRKSDF